MAATIRVGCLFHWTGLCRNSVYLNLITLETRGIRTERSSAAKWFAALRESHAKSDGSKNQLEGLTPNPPNEGSSKTRRSRHPQITPTRGDRNLIIEQNNQHQRLTDAVTPLASLNYQEQIRIKYRQSKEILKELGSKLKAAKSPARKDGIGLPCKLKDIIPSPQTEFYRNKDEFRIKHGIDGNPKTVGFLVGNFSEGTAMCINPTKLISIRPAHVKLALSFQDYIRCSPLPICDLFSDGGQWRGVTARSNLNGDLMCVIVMHPQDMSGEELTLEKNLLKEYFSEGDGKACGIKSLYFQACRHSRCTNEVAPFELLFGEPHIYEEMLGLKFRISPDSFFQTNTLGAAYLYKVVQEISEIDEETVVLDISSGTGTIGLLLASKARAVVGIHSVTQAVEDAKFNAKLNGIYNMTFEHGRAEIVLPKLTENLKKASRKVVAVVTPTRSGIHPKVVQALRSCEHIHKLIYISSLPRGEALNNLTLLSARTDSKYQERPFIPKLAVPVDMLPHTGHCELIIVLERSSPLTTKYWGPARR